jgi:hypothetical protein
LTKTADLAAASFEEALSYYSFPEEHWGRIRANNPLQRVLREIRRRTRVVGAFPDGQSALNLAAARLRHIAGIALVDQGILEYRAAQGPADERSHHGLSRSRASPAQIKVRKGHYRHQSRWANATNCRQATAAIAAWQSLDFDTTLLDFEEPASKLSLASRGG